MSVKYNCYVTIYNNVENGDYTSFKHYLLGTHPLLRMQNYRKIFKCEKFSILFSFIIYNFAVEI